MRDNRPAIAAMTRPCPWAVVLLACFCSAIDAHAATSAYEKKLDLLSTIIKQDYLWKHVFLEDIYYRLDRTYYGHIIDNELLKNVKHDQSVMRMAQDATEAAAGGEHQAPVIDTRDLIVPYTFVRNIVFRRPEVGSILDMGLEVLMVSFKCLLYKHMVHLSTLICVEMKRNKSQEKAASWSGKSKEAIESIMMTMGALQFTDEYVLEMLSFFDIYKTKGKDMPDDVKTEYIRELSARTEKMLDYVRNNCVLKPVDNEDKSAAEQVADMIGVYKVDLLYNTGSSFSKSNQYKEMVKNSRIILSKVFGSTPRINSMSKDVWYDILRFHENSEKKQL